MKVSLNNSLCFQMNNRRIGKVNEPGVNGLFSNSIALEAEKVKGDQYIGHSVSQPPKLEDDDYDYEDEEDFEKEVNRSEFEQECQNMNLDSKIREALTETVQVYFNESFDP